MKRHHYGIIANLFLDKLADEELDIDCSDAAQNLQTKSPATVDLVEVTGAIGACDYFEKMKIRLIRDFSVVSLNQSFADFEEK